MNRVKILWSNSSVSKPRSQIALILFVNHEV